MDILDTIWHRWLRRPYSLKCTDTGRGDDVVVLLHGIASSKTVWRKLVDILPSDNWRIIAPDLLGFGDSPRPQWNKYTVSEHARMVVALIKSKNIRGTVTLVGHSMGCLVAAQIAATKPWLIKRLVLYEPPLLGQVPEFPGYSKHSERYKVLFEYIASNPKVAQLNNKTMWEVARKVYGFHLSQERWLPFERSLRNTILSQQAYQQLKDVDLPTDIVYGRLDLVVIRRGIKEMFKHNPNVALHLVTDIHGVTARSARYLANLIQR